MALKGYGGSVSQLAKEVEIERSTFHHWIAEGIKQGVIDPSTYRGKTAKTGGPSVIVSDVKAGLDILQLLTKHNTSLSTIKKHLLTARQRGLLTPEQVAQVFQKGAHGLHKDAQDAAAGMIPADFLLDDENGTLIDCRTGLVVTAPRILELGNKFVDRLRLLTAESRRYVPLWHKQKVQHGQRKTKAKARTPKRRKPRNDG